MTTTPESEKYMEISRSLIRQAEAEFEQGDLLQASEKAWGAVATAVKSIAQQRGWNHKHHRLTRAAMGQVADEFHRPHLHDLFNIVETLHDNFYENNWIEPEVDRAMERARRLLTELEELRPLLPRPFPFTSNRQRERWRELTRGTPLSESNDGEQPGATLG